jgi:hypothetical protein
MKRALQGRYLKVATAGESFKAFVPAPLPPRPAIEWSAYEARHFPIARPDAIEALSAFEAGASVRREQPADQGHRAQIRRSR